MVEIISKTTKYITVRMSLPTFKKSGILKDANYDFPTPDEAKVFKRYKNIDTTKLSSFDKLLKTK